MHVYSTDFSIFLEKKCHAPKGETSEEVTSKETSNAVVLARLPKVVIRAVDKGFLDALFEHGILCIPQHHREIAAQELAVSYCESNRHVTIWNRSMGLYFARLPLGASHTGVSEYFKLIEVSNIFTYPPYILVFKMMDDPM